MTRMFRQGLLGMAAAMLVLLLSGCSFYQLKEDPMETPALGNLPADYSIAIMPVVNKTKTVKVAEESLDGLLRREIFSSLSPLGYEDIELQKVDEALSEASIALRVPWNRVPAEYFKETDLADSLLYAEIEKLSRFWVILSGQIKLVVKLTWVDAKTGGVLYTNELRLYNRRFAFPTSIKGAFQAIFFVAGHVLSPKEIQKSIEEFGERVAEVFPDRLGAGAIRLDKVEIFYDGKTLQPEDAVTLKPGDELEVRAWGSQGQKCGFTLSKLLTDLPMEESGETPGYYMGRYTIQRGDTNESGAVKVEMTAKWGEMTSKSVMDGGFRIEAGEPDKLPEEEKDKEKPNFSRMRWVYTMADGTTGEVVWGNLGQIDPPELHSGDQTGVEIFLDKSMYVYVFAYDSDLELECLYPASGLPENPLDSEKLLALPQQELAPLESGKRKHGCIVIFSQRPQDSLMEMAKDYQAAAASLAPEERLKQLGQFVRSAREAQAGKEVKHLSFTQLP